MPLHLNKHLTHPHPTASSPLLEEQTLTPNKRYPQLQVEITTNTELSNKTRTMVETSMLKVVRELIHMLSNSSMVNRNSMLWEVLVMDSRVVMLSGRN
jgi:hypothetical protein